MNETAASRKRRALTDHAFYSGGNFELRVRESPAGAEGCRRDARYLNATGNPLRLRFELPQLIQQRNFFWRLCRRKGLQVSVDVGQFLIGEDLVREGRH